MLLNIYLRNTGLILMIRITITIFILLFISGCAVASKDIFDITRTQLFGYPQEEVTLETISDSNYSFMIAKLGRGREVKLILNSAKDDLFEWIS